MAIQPMGFLNFDRNVSMADLLQALTLEEVGETVSVVQLLPTTLQVAYLNEAFIIILHKEPLSFDIIEDDLAQMNAWPNWKSEVLDWKSFVIVSLANASTADSLKDKIRSLLQFICRVAPLFRAHSVGWSGSNIFKTAADFAKLMDDPRPPVEILVRCIWSSSLVSPDKRLFGGVTRGLNLFGYVELEHPNVGVNVNDVFLKLMRVALYIISSNKLLKAGDTISFGKNNDSELVYSSDGSKLIIK